MRVKRNRKRFRVSKHRLIDAEMRGESVSYVLGQATRRAAMHELMEIGVILATGERRPFQVGRRVSMGNKVHQTCPYRIILHDISLIRFVTVEKWEKAIDQ